MSSLLIKWLNIFIMIKGRLVSWFRARACVVRNSKAAAQSFCQTSRWSSSPSLHLWAHLGWDAGRFCAQPVAHRDKEVNTNDCT